MNGPTRAALAALLLAAGACAAPAGPGATATGPAPGEHVFTYTPPAGAPPVASVAVAGSFNHWSTSATPMERQPDGSWRARVRLEEGEHRYKFHINGRWPADMCLDRTWGDPARNHWIDPAAQRCEDDGQGGRNAVVGGGVPAPVPEFHHDPRDPAHLSAAGGRLSIRFHAPAQRVRSAAIHAGDRTLPMHRQATYGGREVWRGTLPEGTRRYSIALRTDAGVREHGPFAVPAAPFRAVPWVGGAVGYQVFPERFWNGDPSNDRFTVETDEHPLLHPELRGEPPVLTPRWDGPVTEGHCCHQYFGGDLQGVIDRLDHLQSLGVTLLYLNPVFSAGSAHGYDTFDYLRVEPSFGDERVLRTLLRQARARGMRVIWDFVPNHVGVGHPAFQDAVRRGTASPYRAWFHFRVPAAQVQVGNPGHYETWAGAGSLPKLDTRNPAVRAYLMGVVRRWTRFGFDGIRVDVPGEIANSTEFFREFRRTAKSVNPEVYLVGEIWQRSPGWLRGDQFDALMNYAIGQDVVERWVAGRLPAEAALEGMARLYAEYPEAATAMQFNLISSHDTGRLLTKLGGGGLGDSPGADALARHRLASAMLYALPGVPVTFQGDECALLGAGGGREENRYPVQWDRCDRAMVAHYQRLARLRRELPALASPAIRLHHGADAVLAWLRGEPGPGEVLALFNAGPARRSLALPAGTWVDAATNRPVTGSADLEPWGWRFLHRR